MSAKYYHSKKVATFCFSKEIEEKKSRKDKHPTTGMPTSTTAL